MTNTSSSRSEPLTPVMRDEPIFAGVVLVGKIKIGKNCIVGANSVVLSDIPDNSVAVGAPARVVKTLGGSEEGH